MVSQRFSVSVAVSADTAYIRMTDAEVVRTREVTDEVLVDLDRFNMVVGVEVLRLDAEIPFQRLVDEFHVPSAAVERLRELRPSIGVRISTGSDGAAAINSQIRELV